MERNEAHLDHFPLFINELRIGNWVYNYQHQRQIEVAGIDPDTGILDGWFVIYKTEEGKSATFIIVNEGQMHIQGICLTDRWLIRMGFEKCNDNDDWYSLPILNKMTTLLVNPKLYVAELSVNDFNAPVGPTVFTSVHQLQNLYYALVGEELKIDE